MRLIFDIDDVIRDWSAQLVSVFRKEYPNRRIKIKQTYDLSQWSDMGRKIFDFAFNEMAKEVYLYALPERFALSALKELHEQKHKIILASSQPSVFTRNYTTLWLAQNEVVFDELHYTNYKWMVPGNLFVDDCTANLVCYSEVHSAATVVAFSRPWNKDWKGARVNDWNNLLEFVNKMMGDEI